ncbi:binding-protein-dependent transport systems inner membrane component [Beutenbergia cavernae DSM 12333]|uniref:Binding-protein-dependent transport systems inner membrane component n=1 Tax=Beutenbergia cavernae (strain ATCC BAA-8 / DSM 12333 / CCUG 43141 / JCM 11478 / NBRC 16432 / NCIMB 13614 / HKI 0122) TaxID=471853 RepID=C5BUT2_BEUC1|nr:ABC transporter permease [Beutenbergia cavernae]ACQ78306.1 binding-protein-dependent transport systems inner membrane component [Beutenbergia cavernae DSM 12333]
MSIATQDPELAAAEAAALPRKKARILPPMTPKLAVGLVIAGLITIFGLVGPWFVGDPSTVNDVGLAPPSSEFWLGTTQTGQDVFAQLAYATRGSLIIGVIVGALTLVMSAFFGVVGAFAGGWTDEAFSLVTNVMLVIPGLPLVIVISSYVSEKSVLLVAVVLALTSWAGSARVLRGFTLSVRNRDYVLAARVSGEPSWRILAVEILPNLIPLLASQVVFAVIFGILGEAGLSFLGLGATGSFTWGTMLYYAQNGLALRLGAWWWFVPPGLLLAVFGAALSLINFSIDTIINPKLRDSTREVRKGWRMTRQQLRKAEEEVV